MPRSTARGTRRWVPLLTLALTTLAVWSARVPHADASSPGPGSVLAVHHRLLRALETGDRAAQRACFSSRRDVELSLVGEDRGEPIEVASVDELGKAFSRRRATGESLGWTSAILESTTECPSGDLAAGTIVFERRCELGCREGVRRYRSTALLRREDGALRIHHWHVSPAERFEPLTPYRPTTDGEVAR